jgi:glycosyltransferase involved in cell wall biosynthesis
MELSSPRFKSVAVTAGLSFWFFIIISAFGIFSFEILLVFIVSVFIITQILSSKISKGLDILAKINTKIFLGALFIFVISIYGIFFRVLRIDLLRLKKQTDTYWLDMEHEAPDRMGKQY